MSVYLVWVLDCEACGDITYGNEDDGSLPDECPECGEPKEPKTDE